jgi:hypothetical protein
MRRVCFDTTSDYFHSFLNGYLNTPEQAREQFRDTEFRFDAATAFIHETNQCFDFVSHEELFAFLIEADEIVTFNGRTCDLIVLESLIGENAFKKIWEKPHHDLKGWKEQSLKASISCLIPELKQSYDSIYQSARYAELSSIKDEFIRGKLAGTYRDAKCTLELFRLYLASGNTEFTFRDLIHNLR